MQSREDKIYFSLIYSCAGIVTKPFEAIGVVDQIFLPAHAVPASGIKGIQTAYNQ